MHSAPRRERRTMLVAAMALLMMGLVTSPAWASRPGHPNSPTFHLQCDATEYWAQSAPSGVPGWDYYADDGKPLAVVSFGAISGNQPTDHLTFCVVHGPVYPGTNTYDADWGFPEETTPAYFLFL
ncbi:MAG: hypothetical protein ACXVPP_09550 [Actinomycetota bacterium]